MNRSRYATATQPNNRLVREVSWGAQNQQGRLKAQSLIAHMSDTTNPTILGREVQGIVGNNRFDGVAVGFFQELSERLIGVATPIEPKATKKSAPEPSNATPTMSLATTPSAETQPAAIPMATPPSATPPATLPATEYRLVRVAELTTRLSISTTTLYRYMNRGLFPRPVRLGGVVFWVESELREWMAAQSSKRSSKGASTLNEEQSKQ